MAVTGIRVVEGNAAGRGQGRGVILVERCLQRGVPRLDIGHIILPDHGEAQRARHHSAIAIIQIEGDGQRFHLPLGEILELARGETNRAFFQVNIDGDITVRIVGVGRNIGHDDAVTVDVFHTGQEIDPQRLALTQ